MSESTLNAIITAIGSLLGGIIGAYATIQAAKLKLPKSPTETQSKFPLLGIVIGTVIGAVATLSILAFLGYIPSGEPPSAPIDEPIAQEPNTSWTLGNLIYEENFEDGTVTELKTTYGFFDIVQMTDGNHAWQTTQSGGNEINLPTTSNDYAVEVKIMQVSGQKGFGSIEIRRKDEKPCKVGYATYLDAYGDWLNLVEYGFTGGTCDEIRQTGLFANYKTSLSNGTWYTIRMEAKGSEIRVYLNENLVAHDKDIDGTVIESNTMGIFTCCGDLEPFVFNFDDIKVWLVNP